ncbi:MAG: hypothetical protein PUD15_00415 [Prevotella sp.]|uniref:hypothetical protein n=1 Tax=Prevotella sp. AGR2160 TaxID=1280674 RepID=UPI000491264D|nr:hypothetical protein [Prevotella sp. AGR2160]MDD5861015.1 hypothetical protein [Prevotella sp.]
MKATEQTNQQLERFFNKIAEKFPPLEEPTMLTDIHLRANPDNGDLLAYDDDDNEITRVVIDQWINNTDETFFDAITLMIRGILKKMSKTIDNFGILKPFSIILENDDKEQMAELYLADDDTVILGGDIMQDLDKDLNSFLDNLLKE